MSDCVNLEPDDLGCLVLPLVQFNTKELVLQFEDDSSGTMQHMDLTQFDTIKCTFRVDKNNRLGNVYRTLDLNNGLSVAGVDNHLLLFNFKESFYESQMPAVLKFDILMKNSNVTRTYTNGTAEVHFVNTQP